MRESIVLTLENERHSKTYLVSLEEGAGGWVVNFQYGAIGSPLKGGTKTKTPVGYSDAKRVYDGLVSEKTGKPCSCCGGTYGVPGTTSLKPPSDSRGLAQCATVIVMPSLTRPKPPVPAAQVVDVCLTGNPAVNGVCGDVQCPCSPEGPGFSPELLEPITEADAVRYIGHPKYGVQRKYDGNRVSVATNVVTVVAYNRLGKQIQVPGQVGAELLRLATQWKSSLMLDGEFIHGEYVAFDLLDFGGDTKGLPFLDRWGMLARILMESTIKLADLQTTVEAKQKAFDSEKAHRGEGVVFKRLDAPYMPGRQGKNVKCKFWHSATVRIAKKQKNTDHHSFGTEVMRDGRWVYTGSVTCRSAELPEIGSYREVRMLYVGTGGHLYQPCDLGERQDVTDQDCSWDQLKHKQSKERMLA